MKIKFNIKQYGIKTDLGLAISPDLSSASSREAAEQWVINNPLNKGEVIELDGIRGELEIEVQDIVDVIKAVMHETVKPQINICGHCHEYKHCDIYSTAYGYFCTNEHFEEWRNTEAGRTAYTKSFEETKFTDNRPKCIRCGDVLVKEVDFQGCLSCGWHPSTEDNLIHLWSKVDDYSYCGVAKSGLYTKLPSKTTCSRCLSTYQAR